MSVYACEPDHDGGVGKLDHPENGEKGRTFSSSSFFSERFLRLRAVSSRRSAISSSVSCFFFLDDSAV